MLTSAAMRIGDEVIYHGRVLVLRGIEPMSVPDAARRGRGSRDAASASSSRSTSCSRRHRRGSILRPELYSM